MEWEGGMVAQIVEAESGTNRSRVGRGRLLAPLIALTQCCIEYRKDVCAKLVRVLNL